MTVSCHGICTTKLFTSWQAEPTQRQGSKPLFFYVKPSLIEKQPPSFSTSYLTLMSSSWETKCTTMFHTSWIVEATQEKPPNSLFTAVYGLAGALNHRSYLVKFWSNQGVSRWIEPISRFFVRFWVFWYHICSIWLTFCRWTATTITIHDQGLTRGLSTLFSSLEPIF